MRRPSSALVEEPTRVVVRVHSEFAHKLRRLADDLERSQQSLGVEALEMLFQSYGIPLRAPDGARGRRRGARSAGR